jgi:hypothetical protein
MKERSLLMLLCRKLFRILWFRKFLDKKGHFFFLLEREMALAFLTDDFALAEEIGDFDGGVLCAVGTVD